MQVRTILDHIYFNPVDYPYRAIFSHTLPPGASVSYFGAFKGLTKRKPTFFSKNAPSIQSLSRMRPKQLVSQISRSQWGKVQEAKLMPTYDNFPRDGSYPATKIRTSVDEADAPNTFQSKLHLRLPRGYHRVLLAYEETLPLFRGHRVFRLPFPTGVDDKIDFSLSYRAGKTSLKRSNLKKLHCRGAQKKEHLRCSWTKNKPKRAGLFFFRPKNRALSWISGKDPSSNKRYLFAQVRMQLPKNTKRDAAEQAVFLLDTSLSNSPDTFAAYVKLLRSILKNNRSLRRFNILFFDVSARWGNPRGWWKNTPRQRKKVFRLLDQLVLEGATHFARMFDKLARPSWHRRVRSSTKKKVDIFVLSDGQISWGHQMLDAMFAGFHKRSVWSFPRFFSYQMGFRGENTAVLRRFASGRGAFFPCIGQGGLLRCSTAHTLPAFQVQKVELKGIGARDILVSGRQPYLFSGSSFSIAAQHAQDGPAMLLVHGRYMGKKMTKRFRFKVKTHGDLGPRAWAELAISQMMELRDGSVLPLIMAFSQHFRIPNTHCYYKFLAPGETYQHHSLRSERLQQKIRDLSRFIATKRRKKGRAFSKKHQWLTLLKRMTNQFMLTKTRSGRTVHKLLRVLPASHFRFRKVRTRKLLLQKKTTKAYLKKRLKVREHFAPFIKEAKKRLKRSPGAAVKVLSSIVELHPTNPEALRLVGYYLSAWGLHHQAAAVFFRVLEKRYFEPHAFRDVAHALLQLKRYGLAAALYEIMLAGHWQSRFRGFRTLAREEYALLIFEALRDRRLSARIRKILKKRRFQLALKPPKARLRVTVTWNTDNTDIDLWVTGPSKQKCHHRKRSTRDGGRLLSDVTRGYGPERYENKRARKGRYHVQLQFFGNASSTFGNETHASVLITRYAGTRYQKTIRKNIILKHNKQIVSVTTLSF